MFSAATSGSRPLLPPASKRGHSSKLACTARGGERPQTGGKKWVPGPSSPAYFWLCFWVGEHKRAARSGKDENLCWLRSPALHSARGLLWLHRALVWQVVPDPPHVLSRLSWNRLVMRDSSEELRPAGLPGKPQKSSHSPWVLTREGKYKNSDWQKTNYCWVRALCHCLL